MSIARTLFDPRGSVGRGPLWTFYLVRTLLGVGLIKVSVTDAVWDDWYKTTLLAVFAWPTHVALPIKRLHDLGRSWRTWAVVWGVTVLVAVIAYVAAARPLGYELADAMVPGGMTLRPADAPPFVVALVLATLGVHLVYGVFLYFVPGRSAREAFVSDAATV